MTIDPARVKSLFLTASDLSDPVERAAYMDRECGGDAELRARVVALLRADEDAPSPSHENDAAMLTHATDVSPGVTGTFSSEAPDAPVGTVTRHPADAPNLILAGRYKLVEAIGEGGMGTVWMAQQFEPVKRAVAVKLIKAGMDSRAVLARFEAERQALALMDHPNIAKVLDAGLTADGRPFFVMELVKGVPITEFCDLRRLSPRERLELFVPVCLAIQHAHQKGVIHRDIKPSNVLVALYDDRPVPKVIDFGVAKAAGSPLTDKTLMTGFGAVVGTPEYMSPEQASFNQLDVDTRSDVYSLGVLLYELLTGSPPHPRQSLEKAGLLEILRVIREQDPPRPSDRLSTSQTLASIAAVRGTEPDGLTRLVRGELDWLVMKALEKDRARRYETANGLAADVQRYLAGEPVLAVPPTAGYRVRKFARRHRSAVVTALAFTVLLVVGATISFWQAVLATRAEREAVTQRDRAAAAERRAVAERDAASRAEGLAIARADDLAYRLGVNAFVLAAAAYDKGNALLAADYLGHVPPRQRNWEWNFLRERTRGGLFSLYGHQSELKGVAFSPDGTRILTGSRDGTARLWDASTGTPVLELRGHTGCLSGVAFSPDGTRVMTGSADHTAKVWDARAGTLLLDIRGHTDDVRCVAFSPDGMRLLTGSNDQTARLWDASTGNLVSEIKGHGGVTGVAFSPDGQRAATCDWNGLVLVSDAHSGTVLTKTQPERSVVLHGIAFSPDGTRLVTACEDQTAKIWDAVTGDLLLDRKCNDIVHCVAFSPDGARVVIGGYGATAVFDARTGASLTEFKGFEGEAVECVSFSPDGMRVVTGHQNGTATVWDAQSDLPSITMKGNLTWVTAVAFSSDGLRLATGRGAWEKSGEAHVWDARTGEMLLQINETAGRITSVAFSPDGSRLATGTGKHRNSGEVRVWDAKTGVTMLTIRGHSDEVLGVAFSPDGSRIVTAGADQMARIWDSQTGVLQVEFKGQLGAVRTAVFSPDGTRVITASGDTNVPGEAKVWDAQSGALLVTLRGHSLSVNSAAFSPDGTQVLTGGEDSAARLWDAKTGTLVRILKGHKGGITKVQFSPDGERIITSGDSLVVWDARTGSPLLDLSQWRHATFSPDGLRIAGTYLNRQETGQKSEVAILKVATMPTSMELRGHTGAVWPPAIAYSPDGARVATGGLDGTAKVWNARTGTPVVNLEGHTANVATLAFSSDGSRIATGSWDGSVKFWDSQTGKLLSNIEGRAQQVWSVDFSPDGSRLVTFIRHLADSRVTGVARATSVKVWDTKSGALLLDLKPSVRGGSQAFFSQDGAFIILQGFSPGQVWDARNGKEVPSEPTLAAQFPRKAISPDGRWIAYPVGNLVELIPLQPDAQELAYRKIISQPDPRRYRWAYDAARAANDEFAAAFYLKLLAPADRAALELDVPSSPQENK